MKRYLYIFVLLISIFSFAQTEVKISADTNQVFIGDIINLNIQVNSSEQILWPDIEEVITPLEIQNLSSIDSSFVNNQYVYSQNLSVQQFDTGLVVLPQLPFVSFENDTFYSDSLFFSFLAVPLDTTNAIFDIKSPKKVPLTSQRRNHISMVLLVSSYLVYFYII